jgi:hypothetical protein
MTRLPSRLRARAAPKTAVLSDSLPQEVKITSLCSQPIARATLCLAASILCCASAPSECSDDGLPKWLSMCIFIRSAASAHSGVVALLSK